MHILEVALILKKKSSIRFGINIDLDFCVRFVPLLFFLFVFSPRQQSIKTY